MDRKLVLNFNAAYAAEAAPEEKQLVNDLLVVWGKLEPAAAKNPALIRKGVLFGMSLQKAITEGRIILPEEHKHPQHITKTGKPGIIKGLIYA